MRRLLATLFCAAMLFGATSAQAASPAEAYPSGPISLVVCYTPGGATDLQARLSALVAQDPKYFGQPIVILNKPGAGGMTELDHGTRQQGRPNHDRLQHAPFHRPIHREQDEVQRGYL